MKKVLALVLAVVMCVGMASVAFGISTTKPFDKIEVLSSNVDNYGTYWTLEDGTIAYVAGDTFYLFPVFDSGEGNIFAGDADGSQGKLTEAKVTQGSTTVYSPAVYYDTKGNAPTNRWVVQMKTADIAAVKDYTTKLVIKGEWNDQKFEQTINLTTKDTGMIDENDINRARIDDADVVTNGKYVVSADAFKAIKSGETFKFPYDGYTLIVGSGIKNSLNFRASLEKIDKLVEKYGEDKILGFLDFKDKNDLPVEIGVEMECTEFSNTHKTNKAYVYRLEGDKLVLVTDKATYDSAREVVSFKTNKLGSLIISAEPLKNASSETTTKATTTSSNKKNPGTGANDVVGLAVAGVIVAAAAGAVALKK